MKTPQLLLLSLLVFLPLARANLTLPALFTDHMVLQQKQADPVWGWDIPSTKVTVYFAGKSYAAIAAADGKWMVKLDPMPAHAEPQVMRVEGTSKKEISDVLIGEVWICSGQSNMGLRLRQSRNGDLEVLAAHHPLLRLITVPNYGTQELQKDFHGKWEEATPESAAPFSAVGYLYGNYLQESLQVPVGMINNAWGGSTVDAWMARSLLNSDPRCAERINLAVKREAELLPDNGDAEAAKITAKWEADCAKAKAEKKTPPWKPIDRWLESAKRPGNIYAGVLYPEIGYGIKGVIWYQGESDGGRPWEYGILFPMMIKEWRQEWGQGDFPFYWVQLPNFASGASPEIGSFWAEIREAQTKTQALPNTAQVVAIEQGEVNDIHPKRKQEVAARLARIALSRDYGMQLPWHSPEWKGIAIKDGKAIITVDTFGSKLIAFSVNDLQGFTICGKDQKWLPAKAKLVNGTTIEVWNDEMKAPVAIRYAWGDAPICNLMSVEGLPLTPFRTDSFELPKPKASSTPPPPAPTTVPLAQ